MFVQTLTLKTKCVIHTMLCHVVMHKSGTTHGLNHVYFMKQSLSDTVPSCFVTNHTQVIEPGADLANLEPLLTTTARVGYIGGKFVLCAVNQGAQLHSVRRRLTTCPVYDCSFAPHCVAIFCLRFPLLTRHSPVIRKKNQARAIHTASFVASFFCTFLARLFFQFVLKLQTVHLEPHNMAQGAKKKQRP